MQTEPMCSFYVGHVNCLLAFEEHNCHKANKQKMTYVESVLLQYSFTSHVCYNT